MRAGITKGIEIIEAQIIRKGAIKEAPHSRKKKNREARRIKY